MSSPPAEDKKVALGESLPPYDVLGSYMPCAIKSSRQQFKGGAVILTEVQRVQGTFVKPKDEIQCGLKPGLSVLSKLHSVHCLVQGASCCPGWTDAKATASVGLTEAIETL